MTAPDTTPEIPPVPDDFLVRNAPDLDVEAIMAEIRARIAEKQRAGLYRGVPPLALSAPPPPGTVQRLEERLALLKMYARQNLAGAPISSHRRLLGPLITRWKRFVRFWVRSYTDALFMHQQLVNEEIVAMLEDLAREIGEIKQRAGEPPER